MELKKALGLENEDGAKLLITGVEMQMEISIMTERGYEKRSFYQVVWEWEDVLFEEFSKLDGVKVSYKQVKAIKVRALQVILKYIIPRFQMPISRPKDELIFYFPLRVWHCNQYLRKGFIPIFTDVYDYEIDVIHRMTKQLPFYFVTIMDIYDKLKSKYPACKVQYMPLSVSDKWVGNMPEKSIDVIQIGRKSKYLHEIMLKYCESHPSVDYMYMDYHTELQTWGYFSTKRGYVGVLETRDQFMEALRSAKVSLVSTPGIETGRFGNIDFFTPRFFESAASYCWMLGHYTENNEAKYLEINTVCPNIRDYKEFEKYLDLYLSQQIEKDKVEYFLSKNKTSCRARQIYQCANRFLLSKTNEK